MIIFQEPGISDDEIIQGLINGQKKSSSHLFDKYNKNIYRICRQKQIQHEDAVEIISDVMYEVILNIERYNPEISTLKSWVCMIAHRRAIDFIRKSARKGEVLKDKYFWDNQTADKSIKSDFFRNEFILIVELVLEKLSAREKTVLSLILQNYEYKEISEKLNIEYGNVKTIYSRALKKAKDEYNQMIDEGVLNGKLQKN